MAKRTSPHQEDCCHNPGPCRPEGTATPQARRSRPRLPRSQCVEGRCAHPFRMGL